MSHTAQAMRETAAEDPKAFQAIPLGYKPNRTIIGFQTPDALVYHYTRMDIARDFIIPKRKLKVGSITKTNDPKETRNWKFTLATQRNGNLLAYNTDEWSKKLSHALKANTKVACFSRDAQPLSGDHTRDIFLRGWGKPRMWAHYAGNHTGVCLVFDRQKLDHSICKTFGFYSKVYRGDVVYVNRGIAYDWHGDFTLNVDELERRGFEAYVSTHFHTFVKQLFFQKMRDWRDESEFRWIVQDDNPEDAFVDITHALVAIIYGDDANPKDTQNIIEATRDLSLEHMGLKWTNSSPWYDFINPLYFSQDLSTVPELQ